MRGAPVRTAEDLRRLDALAASRVLGISRDEWWESPEYGWNYLNEGRTLSSELRHYTTDATACQELKDKARADGWRVLVGDPEVPVPAFWCQMSGLEPTHDGVVNVVAETELVAVVLACVRAYGAEV